MILLVLELGLPPGVEDEDDDENNTAHRLRSTISLGAYAVDITP